MKTKKKKNSFWWVGNCWKKINPFFSPIQFPPKFQWKKGEEETKTVFDRLLGGCLPEILAFLGNGNIFLKENPFTFDDSYTLEESRGDHPNMLLLYPKFSLSPPFFTKDFDNTWDWYSGAWYSELGILDILVIPWKVRGCVSCNTILLSKTSYADTKRYCSDLDKMNRGRTGVRSPLATYSIHSTSYTSPTVASYSSHTPSYSAHITSYTSKGNLYPYHSFNSDESIRTNNNGDNRNPQVLNVSLSHIVCIVHLFGIFHNSVADAAKSVSGPSFGKRSSHHEAADWDAKGGSSGQQNRQVKIGWKCRWWCWWWYWWWWRWWWWWR